MSFAPDLNWPAFGQSFNAQPGATVDPPAPGLAAVELPFPIISPFAVRSDLQKFTESDQGLVRLDAQYPHYAREKLRLLRAGACGFLRTDAARDSLPALLSVVRGLAAERPGFASLNGAQIGRGQVPLADLAEQSIDFRSAGLRWSYRAGQASVHACRADANSVALWLNQRCAGQPACESLACALALSLQEDFVLMQAPSPARAQALFVCFPSGWSPLAKLGADLTQIHQPVADGETLRRASAGLSQAMLTKGPFVRYVWTLSESDALDRHPEHLGAPDGAVSSTGHGSACESSATNSGAANSGAANSGAVDVGPGSAKADPLAGIWYRCERQTLLALPALQSAVFFIRVYVAPLAQAAHSDARKAMLVDALRSMSAAVIEYKNLGHLRQRVLSAWA